MHSAEPFMEWVVEAVLPLEVRKLASDIEEKDAAFAHRDDPIETLEFMNEEHQQKILKLKEKISDLIANRYVACCGYFDNVLCSINKSSKEVHLYYVIRCQHRQLEKYKRPLLPKHRDG